MIKCIIFSKDRPMQLDATLRSLFLHCNDSQEIRYVVLHQTTSEISNISYKQLAAAYPEVKFVAQKDFRRDVIRLLNPFQKGTYANLRYQLLSRFGYQGYRTAGRLIYRLRLFFEGVIYWLAKKTFPDEGASSEILFLVDDNIFIRDFSIQPAAHALHETPYALGFSLRLGRNTTFNYIFSQPQPVPDFNLICGDLLKYNWTNAELDFAYPLEVSSSLYLAKIILPLLLLCPFRNPNELEAALVQRTKYCRRTYFEMLCYQHSVTFCNPINVVQSVFRNRAGELIHYSIDDLLNRFAGGERIDVTKYNDFIPNSCHQEVELHFEQFENEHLYGYNFP